MSSIKRPNYFTGRLLSAEDLVAEQEYHREQRRLHNRLAHGTGVARGLSVAIGGSAARPAVTVKPGYGIDPAGNELELESTACLGITSKARAFVVVIEPKERLVDPVPVSGAGDTGDEFQYLRVEEYCEAALHPDDPPRAAGTGLVLARFVQGRGAWRRDPRFKLRRLRR